MGRRRCERASRASFESSGDVKKARSFGKRATFLQGKTLESRATGAGVEADARLASRLAARRWADPVETRDPPRVEGSSPPPGCAHGGGIRALDRDGVSENPAFARIAGARPRAWRRARTDPCRRGSLEACVASIPSTRRSPHDSSAAIGLPSAVAGEGPRARTQSLARRTPATPEPPRRVRSRPATSCRTSRVLLGRVRTSLGHGVCFVVLTRRCFARSKRTSPGRALPSKAISRKRHSAFLGPIFDD